ncbi:hypothetical protein D1872_270280 [compost metagenome]
MASLNLAGQKWTGIPALSLAHSRTFSAALRAPLTVKGLEASSEYPLSMICCALGATNSISLRLTNSAPSLSASLITHMAHSSIPGATGISTPTLIPVSFLARPTLSISSLLVGWKRISSSPAESSAASREGVAYLPLV